MCVALVYLVQHAQKLPKPGDPGLTDMGHVQAVQTAQWLNGAGVAALYSSPFRRAWQTAQAIADLAGLPINRDDRLRERMNWDGRQPLAEFSADWDRSVRDRDFVPSGGDSSRQAAARLIAFLSELPDSLPAAPGEPSTASEAKGAVAAVTHGGVITDLLRTLLGDAAIPDGLMEDGVPPGGITTLAGLRVVAVARTGLLRQRPGDESVSG